MENDFKKRNTSGININLRDGKNPFPKPFGPPPMRSETQMPPRSPMEPRRPNVPTEDIRKGSQFIVKVFDWVINISLFAMFFGFPLFFTGLSLQGVIFEKQMFFYFWLLLGLVAWAAKGVAKGEMNIARTPLDFPILGFWLAYIAATVFSVDRWISFWGAFSDPSRGLIGITALVIAYYFIFSNFTIKRLKMMLGAIIFSGALLSIWTFLAIMGIKFLPETINRLAPVSLAGSITALGAFLSFLIPLMTLAILKMAEWKEYKSSLAKLARNASMAALLLLLILDLFLILALYNYVAWIGLFIGVAILLVFILAKIMRPNPVWIWLPMAVFVLVMIVRMIGAVSIAKINIPIEVSLNYQTSYEIAKDSLKDKFVTGSGPATYGYDFSLNRPQDLNQSAFYNLRFFQGTGIFAESLATLGILGIIFILLLVLSYIGTQFYFLYKDKEKNKLYSLGLFSAAAILATDALFIRADGVILTMAAIIATLALATALWESEKEPRQLSLTLKASPKFALALAFVFMVISVGVAFLFVFFGKVYAADFYAGRAARNISENPDQALGELSHAVELNGRESRYYVQMGQYYMALVNSEAMKGENNRDIGKIEQYLNFSIAAASRAKNMSVNDVTAVESLALIYENASLYVPDSLKLAEENYRRALELEPHNPIYFLKLGQIKIQAVSLTKNADEKKQLVQEAENFFQRSIDEKVNYADGYYQLALAKEALADFDGAIENGVKAATINPQNADFNIVLGRMYQQRGKNDDKKMAEYYYKKAVSLNDADINSHFYLGLFYEKNGQKDETKTEYRKVISLLEKNSGNSETISQLKKMITNVDKGIENTPENLGLVQEASENETQPAPVEPAAQPANSNAPTIEEAIPTE